MSTVNPKTNDEKRERPHAWEDALILAFRDQQWQRELKCRIDKLSRDDKEGKRRDLGEIAAELSRPPALLAKLDGLAETSAGDTLTAASEHFYLVEFKAERAGRKMEESKPLYRFFQALPVLASSLGLADVNEFIALSERGHYLAYGKLRPKRAKALPENDKTLELIQLHELQVMAEPYIKLVVAKGMTDEEAAAQDKASKRKAAELVSIMWPTQGTGTGLTISEMAAYLWVLSHLVSQDGEADQGAVVRCAVLSDAGLFLPVWGLSELMLARKFFETAISKRPETEDAAKAEVLRQRFKGLSDIALTIKPTVTSTDNPHSAEDAIQNPPRGSNRSKKNGH